MPDVGEVAGNAAAKGEGFFSKIINIVDSTHIPQQLRDVDVGGLFTNPWFLVPFVALIGWNVWKQNFKEIILIGIITGIWYVSGTEYMATLIIGNELQIGKILPVMFGGAAVLGVIIYMYVGRS